MKRGLLAVGLVALAVTLALVAGSLLPRAARPVIIGVMAGVVASLPTSLFIVWRVAGRTARAPQPQRPTTIIVMPPAAPAPPTGSTIAARSPDVAKRAPRPFTIFGGQDEQV